MLNSDQQNREQAINPNQSFIIQAPAGSGKTSLLIQRYLVLLAKAEKPEEILAITFTRKAAVEMRSRILAALNNARTDSIPNDPHKLKIWNLASAALKHSQEAGWHLIENPNRLHIQTIDSFCSQLARQMPLLSSLGANLKILKDQEMLECYHKAVRNLLSNLDEQELQHNSDLADLLLYLDNDFPKVEKLLANILARRDQWLPHIMRNNEPHKLRQIMERSLTNVIQENITNCQKNFPKELFTEIKVLTEYATSLVTEFDDPDSWQEIAKVLLTKEYKWRQKVDARNGFPAESNAKTKEQKVLFKTMKDRMENLLEKLTKGEEIKKNLEVLLNSPSAQYDDQQWKIILALINILKVLSAYYLPQIFREHQAVDYIEIALAAERALENCEAPTDLALMLDYKIKHILVDEFQDTSITQYRLLEKLTTSWQPNDGRTLFLVGDPMQSIYKFREAKVGLFLRAKQQKRINSVPLIPLTLNANFRSDKHIIDWLNKTFVNIFPKTENIGYGAVSFIPSTATNNINIPQKIKLHSFSENGYDEEAQKIVAIIQQIQQIEATHNIAILVRSRNHLNYIIPALKQAKIIYQAIELETLNDNTVIKDLFILTRALLNLADDVAWFSILRAPWCGLTLADLHTLASNTSKEQTLWLTLANYQQLNLSSDAKIRLNYVVNILNASLAKRSRQPLRQWIKNTWIELNGHLYLTPDELENAEKFFNLLNAQDQGGYIENLALLEQQLNTLYADSQNINATGDGSIQIMTIHKSKGLEFDTVIIPALDRKLKSSEQEILMWTERPNVLGGENEDLILAPITESGQEANPIYKYLRFENQQKEYNELSRLLYVAVTRAKKELHLLASISDKKPLSGTLLEHLWPYFENIPKLNSSATKKIIGTELLENHLIRLPIDTFTNTFPPKNSQEIYTNIFPEFKDSTARNIGTVIHESLQYLSTINLDNWLEKNLEHYRKIWRIKLMNLGVLDNLDECTNKIA